MKVSKKQVEEFRKALIANLTEYLDSNDDFLESEHEVFEECFPEAEEYDDIVDIWNMITKRDPKEIANFAYPKYLKGTNNKKKKK